MPSLEALESDVIRSREAKQLLENPLLIEAFTAIEAEVLRQWKASTSIEDRERMWIVLNVLGKTRGYLDIVVEGGKKAAADIDYAEKHGLLNRARSFLHAI